jgi:hypothetical protein
MAILLDKLEYAWLVPGYVVAGLGLALVMTPASTDAMNAAPAAVRGQASGLIQTLRQVGGTVGLAIMGTAVTIVQDDHLNEYARKVGATAADRAHFAAVVGAAHGDPVMLSSLPIPTLEALRDSLISGIAKSYYIGGLVLLVGAVLAALLLRRARAADAGPLSTRVAITTRSTLEAKRT